jgi:hypothetical protein
MAETVTISAPRHFSDGGWPAVQATISIEGRRYAITYRASEGPLASGVETFLVAALLPAMRVGAPLQIEGAISPRLYDRLPQIQDIISTWFKEFHRIPISVERAQATESDPKRGVASFFSGGVDSSYTAIIHLAELQSLIFIHGCDIRLHDKDVRAAVSARNRPAAAGFGKTLIEVETDVRDLLDVYTDWSLQAHGPVLASVALLLSPQFRRVYIASTATYRILIPHGSHPLLDPLWSNDATTIVHDGCEATRWQKVERVIAHPNTRTYLRVCWRRPHGEYNCCHCASCVRVMAYLSAVGVLDQFPTFDQPLDLDDVRRMENSGPISIWYTQSLLEEVERRGTQPALAAALRDNLKQADPDAYHGSAVRLAQAQADAHHLEATLNRIYTSRSWRMTAPLRAASDWVRRLRRGAQ